MPPKKKGGKKGKKGKKDKEEGSATGERPTSGKELTELSKEFFMIQVKDLETRLNRYQQKCDALDISNKEFQGKYDQQVKDKKEIVSFLKKQLEQRSDEILDLNDKLAALQQAKDTEKESYEKQLATLKHEFQEMKDQLTSENMILGGKLSSLEEFKVQKDDLMKKFADMEEKLRQQAESHKETIYNLERKAVVDKDRLKKEMVLRVNTVAAEFRKVSNKQMADTTKRTIRENVSINSQLSKMSEKTKDLIQENDDLTDKDQKQKIQIELLESTQEEFAKKNHSNLKVIRMLTEKAKQQEEMIEEYEMREQEYEQLETEAMHLRNENSEFNTQIEEMNKQIATLEKDLLEMTSQKEDEVGAKERLEDVLAAVTQSLTEVLQTPELDDVDTTVKRQTMIERLLLVLNSAVILGKAPPPADLFKQRPKAVMAPLIPKSKNRQPKGQTLTGPSLHSFPHYKLGDLGLVPRPPPAPQNRPHETVAHLSNTTRTKGGQDKKFVEFLAFKQPSKLPAIPQKMT
uniref:cilia- and flagella-associated protein 157-like n=1 Tax=Styela clava TaxID=7725 RepID=UPI00193ABBEF|nr:cilia- and flagella-associated protein 157-like [Styela clava]